MKLFIYVKCDISDCLILYVIMFTKHISGFMMTNCDKQTDMQTPPARSDDATDLTYASVLAQCHWHGSVVVVVPLYTQCHWGLHVSQFVTVCGSAGVAHWLE